MHTKVMQASVKAISKGPSFASRCAKGCNSTHFVVRTPSLLELHSPKGGFSLNVSSAVLTCTHGPVTCLHN